MRRAIIIGCTKSKQNRPVIAGLMYTGGIWQAWRDYGPAHLAMPTGYSLWALSAKYGLVPSLEVIAPYELKLTKEIAAELRPRVTLQAKCLTDAEAAVIGGQLYQELAVSSGIKTCISIDGQKSKPGWTGGAMSTIRRRTKWFASTFRTDEDSAWDSARDLFGAP